MRDRGYKPGRALVCSRGHDLTDPQNRRKDRWECAICHRDRERERRRANIEESRRRAREYQAANREARRAYHKQWRDANLEHVRESARLRARLYRTADEMTLEYKAIVVADPCSYCGAPSALADHIVPLSRGGANDAMNLTASCVDCNRRKHSRSLLEALLSLTL